MIILMSSLYRDWKTVERVLALAIFLIGTLSTGLSSIFPILMISPLMLADYQSGKLDMSSKNF
jgi:hypothetical protein